VDITLLYCACPRPRTDITLHHLFKETILVVEKSREWWFDSDSRFLPAPSSRYNTHKGALTHKDYYIRLASHPPLSPRFRTAVETDERGCKLGQSRITISGANTRCSQPSKRSSSAPSSDRKTRPRRSRRLTFCPFTSMSFPIPPRNPAPSSLRSVPAI
jgi:hypothetical protein